jgi:hypothetical protein
LVLAKCNSAARCAMMKPGKIATIRNSQRITAGCPILCLA